MLNVSQRLSQAGRAGAVTIATNMAGQGTDIILGGNSDYMARRSKMPCLADLLGQRTDAPASFRTNNVMEVAEGFADNIDQSSLKILTLKRIYFHASCPLVLMICYLTCLEARSCLG